MPLRASKRLRISGAVGGRQMMALASPIRWRHSHRPHQQQGRPDLIAPAPRKLEEEACEQTFVAAAVVRGSINQINCTPVFLEPLWAGSTHVMTFRAVTLDWLDHGVLLRLTIPPPDAKKAGLCLVVNVFKPTATKSFQLLRLICRECGNWRHLLGGSRVSYMRRRR